MDLTAELLKRRIAGALPPKAPSVATANGRPTVPDRLDEVDVADLTAIADDEQFLKQAYRRILGRECDISGFVNYLELLRRHVPRRAIVSELMNSEEARKRGVRFTGAPHGSFRPVGEGLSSMRRLPGRLAALGRELVRRVLFTRFDSIDHKLMFLLREVAARTDTIAAKTDSSLWTLSEKLDQYVAHLLQEHRELKERFDGHVKEVLELQERTASLGRCFEGLDKRFRAFEQEETLQRRTLGEASDGLAAGLHALQSTVREASQQSSKTDGQMMEALARVDSAIASGAKANQALMEQIHEQAQEAAAGIERRVGEALAHVDSAFAITAKANQGVMDQIDERAREAAAGIARNVGELGANQAALAGELGSLGGAVAAFREFTVDALAQISAKMRPPVVAAGPDVLVTELDGLIVGAPGNEWRMSAYHAFRGPMEPGVSKLFRTLIGPGSVVVDVGANVGVYTLLAAKVLQGSGKIYSFEPTPRTYRILRENVQVNGFLELGIVDLHQMAVTDRTGAARLSTFSRDCGHNTLFKDRQADGEIEVATTSLDEILCAQERIDLIKIDVEGAEPLVFRGMKNLVERNPRVHIILEFAPVHLRRAGFDPCSVIAEFHAAGFEIRRIDDVNGDLRPVASAQLVQANSVNVLLTRI
jgi:FkbM family methyltransferase